MFISSFSRLHDIIRQGIQHHSAVFSASNQESENGILHNRQPPVPQSCLYRFHISLLPVGWITATEHPSPPPRSSLPFHRPRQRWHRHRHSLHSTRDSLSPCRCGVKCFTYPTQTLPRRNERCDYTDEVALERAASVRLPRLCTWELVPFSFITATYLLFAAAQRPH